MTAHPIRSREASNENGDGVLGNEAGVRAWLVQQAERGGFLGQLAEAASKDRSFPRGGDIEAVRKWLQASRASGDDWEALEDAELDWSAY